LRGKSAVLRALFRWVQELGWRHFKATHHHDKAPVRGALLLWPLLHNLVADKVLAPLGGRLRLPVSGGAPLSATLTRCLVGLGLPLLQGYGLTEAAPVVTVNRPDDNVPESVGVPLPGVEVRLGENSELLVRGPNVMMGYWNRPEDTAKAIDVEGWLHTGDQARIDEGYVFIVGRLKEIIVLSNGEKVTPEDVEMALMLDPLIDQAMVVGEGKPYLAALLVMNAEAWHVMAQRWSLPADDSATLADMRLQHHVKVICQESLKRFPNFAKVRRFWLTLEPWTIDNGLVTPTMKLKRSAIEKRFSEQILQLYGHIQSKEVA
jgi:long-chain acyl-CoA synthetase